MKCKSWLRNCLWFYEMCWLLEHLTFLPTGWRRTRSSWVLGRWQCRWKRWNSELKKTHLCFPATLKLCGLLVKICKKTLHVWFANIWVTTSLGRQDLRAEATPLFTEWNRFTWAPCLLATYLRGLRQFLAVLLLRLLQPAVGLEHTQKTTPLAQTEDVYRHFATGPWAWHLLHMPITERRPRASPNALLWQPKNRQGWALISGQLFIT